MKTKFYHLASILMIACCLSCSSKNECGHNHNLDGRYLKDANGDLYLLDKGSIYGNDYYVTKVDKSQIDSLFKN